MIVHLFLEAFMEDPNGTNEVWAKDKTKVIGNLRQRKNLSSFVEYIPVC